MIADKAVFITSFQDRQITCLTRRKTTFLIHFHPFKFANSYGKIMQNNDKAHRLYPTGKGMSMKKLLPYLKPFKKQCIIGPLCKWLEAVLELILPTIMAFMIDQGIMKQDRSIIFTYGLLMIFMVFIGFCFSLTCQYQASIASQGFGTDMRNRLYQHIMSFSFEDLDRFAPATLLNRIGNDVNQVQLGVAMMIRLAVRAPFIVIGAVMMAMVLDFQLSLILIASIPLIILTLYGYSRLTTPQYHIYQDKFDHFLNVLEQNLSGVRVIRAFLSQQAESERLMDASKDLQAQMLRISRISALLNPITALIINGAIILLLVNGILALPEGIPAGTLIAFINYATQILLALVATSNLIVIFSKASASSQRIFELLAVKPVVKTGTEQTKRDPQIALSCSHMSFTYPQSTHPALSDISFSIRQGETIGVIGGTGSGKSTLAAVMMNFYPGADIKLFGRNAAAYDAAMFSQLITLIPQQNELFSGTLSENLRYGNPNADEAEMWEALRLAQIEAFVSASDDGLAMRIEAGGKNLSGGQRQRICIARGLLRHSDIIIFDDSFSALDFTTDAKLRQALARQKHTTKIIISQRVATIADADHILVLDQGRIVGSGNHRQLYDSCAVYREICSSQNIVKEGIA